MSSAAAPGRECDRLWGEDGALLVPVRLELLAVNLPETGSDEELDLD